MDHVPATKPQVRDGSTRAKRVAEARGDGEDGEDGERRAARLEGGDPDGGEARDDEDDHRRDAEEVLVLPKELFHRRPMPSRWYERTHTPARRA